MTQHQQQTDEHKLTLSHETWKETKIQGALEGKSASNICAYVLQYYVSLADDEKPPQLITAVAKDGKLRSVYLTKQLWAGLVECSIREERPISAILEQQLRAYLGLPLSPTPKET